ncbi:hypothetical protein [Phreatobacter stygius]|uniref:hypothetical protein n=1 Tax=Phreatobacter stygius TaxID=1940610 RepID=UPI0014770172|nr:hypothetical protein [Phreatobacter stygius]
METNMPSLLIGTALAVIAIAAYAMLRKSLSALEPQPVRAQAPIRRLRRDPVTGEYRPY